MKVDSRCPRSLISDKLSPRAVEIFRERGIEADVNTGLDAEALRKIIGGYDGLAIRSATKVTPKLLEAADNLKVVGRAGIGVDNVDIPAATARGIIVMNTPFGNSITTAEHAIAMMFALARQIPQANQSTRAGKWEKSRFMGVELTGKTLGIVGSGNIGSIVADRALGLAMKVVAYDPYLTHVRAVDLGIDKVELDELAGPRRFHHPAHAADRRDARHHRPRGAGQDEARRSHHQLRPWRLDRRGGAEGCAGDRPCGRGGAGRVRRGAGARQPAVRLDSVVCTPHLGASTNEAQENVAIQVAEQMSDFLNTGAVANALNMSSVSAEDAPRLQPYLTLGDLLGSFAGQITESGIREVSIEYGGDAAEVNTAPVTAAILTGLLKPLLDNVNMVSAPAMARDRDISVSETKRVKLADYHT